ncbi:MAG: hypothetical protein H6907_04035 [Hyphomicrobiales bacterium]|nr:hypothetical protein [Hyphomicrobiales bacterium]MCP5370880.1 hypothetical protein [Hyphomicrobiales bacterium]
MFPITVLALFITLGVTQTDGKDPQLAVATPQMQVASAQTHSGVSDAEVAEWQVFQVLDDRMDRCMRRHLRPGEMADLAKGRPIHVTLRNKARDAFRDCRRVVPHHWATAVNERLD